MFTSPWLLSSLLSIISLIGISEARRDLYNYDEIIVEPGKFKYINSPNFPWGNYVPGHTYQWTARSYGPIKIQCDIYNIPWPDVLIIKQSFNDRGLEYYGSIVFTIDSPSNVINFILQSNEGSGGGKFRCVLESKCACGWKNPSKIADGEETGVNEFPMMAGLVDADSMAMPHKGVFCGATIINPKQVITAAHCFEKKNLSRLLVLVGDHNLPQATDTDAARVFTMLNVVIHEYYHESSNDFDIAIININGTIDFHQRIGPVCLPFKNSAESFVNEKVTLLGWGAVEYGGLRSSFLRKAKVNVTSNVECQSYHQSFIRNHQLCTLNPTKDSCQYDSGGPVLWRDSVSTRRLFLVGIISWGGICGNNRPTVNTRISSYVNWIERNRPEGYKYCKNP